jgi:hypothetical protein
MNVLILGIIIIKRTSTWNGMDVLTDARCVNTIGLVLIMRNRTNQHVMDGRYTNERVINK